MSAPKPSIGFVTWDFCPPMGGMGRHVRSLEVGLRRAGHAVAVLSRSTLRLPFGRNLLFSLLLGRTLRRWIADVRPDIVHVHTGPGGVLLLRRPSLCPLVVTANHTYCDQSRLRGQWWKKFLVPWERRTYQLADSIVCLSQDTADSVARAYGIDTNKLTVIPCGFDVSFFASFDRPLAARVRTCVFVGRPDFRKGSDLLLEAWKIVERRVPTARLHLVGFPIRDTSSMLSSVSLSDQELATLLGTSRTVVCPSRLEGFGLVAAESIAAGTPVVATNVLGLRSVVSDQKTGLLAELDPRDLARKLIAILTDDVLWEQLHRGCRQDRDRFDTRIEIDRYREVYASMR